MTGPQPRGHWTGHSKPDSWEMLQPGHIYCVTQSFLDFDGTQHPVGEQWTYLSFNFLPYDDGLSLFVSLDAEQEWHIRMQLRPEEQGAIMRNLSHYLAAPDPAQPSASIAEPAMLPRSNRSTHLLLAASFLALVLGFVTLHLTDDGPGRVAPTSCSFGWTDWDTYPCIRSPAGSDWNHQAR